MAKQLTLNLPVRVAMGRDDFYVSDANRAAVASIDAWRDWPFGKLLLLGPEGSGKTHLAHVFAAQAGARVLRAAALSETDLAPPLGATVVEDAEAVAGDADRETLMFHLHNLLAEAQAPLLVTAQNAPSRWGIGLPDLLSRLQQANPVTLAAPDDGLMAAVMVKVAQDRGLVLPQTVVRYAMLRLDRSLAAVHRFVDALDADTLAAGDRPGVRHVKAILARGEA